MSGQMNMSGLTRIDKVKNDAIILLKQLGVKESRMDRHQCDKEAKRIWGFQKSHTMHTLVGWMYNVITDERRKTKIQELERRDPCLAMFMDAKLCVGS